MNDFAKRHLMKYGWKKGKGLGKHENGITQPVKPKLKFDTAGIGHKSTDWNNWWDSGFNKAANSITVESQIEGVSISVSKESANHDSSKTNLNEEKSKCSTGYSNFLKTSTLLNGTLTTENNANVCEEKNVKKEIPYVPLTDEELFKVCGGRTAHKGARHGLTLNGKLTRIAQQEESLLNTNANINMSKKLHNNNELEDSTDKMINNKNTILPILFTEKVTEGSTEKYSKKKEKKQINDLSHQLNVLCNLSDNDEKHMHATKGKKKALKYKNESRKRKRKEEKRESVTSFDDEGIEKEESDNELDDMSLSLSKKFEKGVIKVNAQEQVSDHSKQECSDGCLHRKKKKRKKLEKKKNEHNSYKNMTSMWEDEESDGLLAKKLKRSYKSDSDVQFLIEDKNINTSETISKTKFSWNEEPVKSHKSRHLPTDTAESLSELSVCFKERTDYLNAKIKKKKQAKLRKKEKKTLAYITKHLETVHFNTEETTEGKNTKKKLNTLVEKLVVSDIATNKTEHLKKSKKKSKKKKMH